jgi:hypothetical protein
MSIFFCGGAAQTRGMEIFLTPEFWSALAAIIVIDLVLAGDNAIVIALAARNLPKTLQRRAIIWGTVGAVAVRASLTVVVVWLLGIPGLMLAGGIRSPGLPTACSPATRTAATTTLPPQPASGRRCAPS